MINRVVLVGRLVRDPEMRTTTTGKSVASFSMAVDKRFKSDGETADFFRISCWEKTAEFVASYLSKGSLVAVDGRLSSRKYTDKDGNSREAIEVVAESVQSLVKNDSQPEKQASTPAEDEYDPFA